MKYRIHSNQNSFKNQITQIQINTIENQSNQIKFK